MNKRKRIVRSSPSVRIAFVSLAAGILAGCSMSTERFGEGPVYTGGTDNQRSILGGPAKQPSYQDILKGPGGTAAGLPAQSSGPVYTESIPAQTRPAPATPVRSAPVSSAALPTTKPQIVSRPAIPVQTITAPEVTGSAPVSWKGWTSAGGTRVKVREGDTVASMSRRFGVPVKAIAAVNDIEYPGQVKPGQTLLIPTYQHTPSNVVSSAASKPVRLPSANSNQSLTTGSIRPAQSVGINAPSPDRKPVRQPSFAEIKAGIVNDAAPVRISTAPRSKPETSTGSIPAATVRTVGTSVPVPQAMPGRPSVSSAPAAPSAPKVSVITAPATGTGEAKPTEPIKRPQIVASADPVEDADAPRFRWPVRGRIISDFGSKPGGARNDGVNLAVPEGTPVKAADAGTVIYAGNELKGFGNLVLLRHSDGWVSAYAHNSKLNVKRGDSVARGEEIANAGASGSVSQPQVHFELRRGNKPVDPLRHLPKS